MAYRTNMTAISTRGAELSDHTPGRRARAALPLVLMYHSIAPYDSDPYQVTVHPRRFDQQMRWLRSRGLRGVSVREVLDAQRAGAGRRVVGLTFDDGYADFAQHALPILTRYGFTGTVFAIAGRLGGENDWDPDGPRKPLLTAPQLRQVADAGIEIGSHGLRHVRLPVADGAALADEVNASRRLLMEVSGQDVTGFCYPYGDIDGRVHDAVRAAGYGYGCAIWRSPLTGQHALPRTFVGDADSPLRMRAKRVRHRLTRGRAVAVAHHPG
jgi:peptidoglycan/xylan/chitin deacetylase (PgdA/CDA1 family)